jgi:hypothetical protein
MSNITPKTPPFVFGYWRPWKKDSNIFDSYLDYIKDVSLVKYGADTIGEYINQASQIQVQAINQLGMKIGKGMIILSNQLNEVNSGLNIISNQIEESNAELKFINRNIDLQIEQQKLSNILLQNISELLRLPDNEKERQRCIELGVKFFVNAKKDSDLFDDALKYFLKAESFMEQDYFVLNRIGNIYLYVEKHLNPEKAMDYFVRAGKYAIVDSDPNSIHLANALIGNFKSNSNLNKDLSKIELLAAESYEKASFSAYVLGKFEDAVKLQSKAMAYLPNTQNRYLLSKYQARNGNSIDAAENLSICIDENPFIFAVVADLKEIDLANDEEVIKMLSEKNEKVNRNIEDLIDLLKTDLTTSNNVNKKIEILTELKQMSFEIKVQYKRKVGIYDTEFIELEKEIDNLIKILKFGVFRSFTQEKTKILIKDLTDLKESSIQEMRKVYLLIKQEITNDLRN